MGVLNQEHIKCEGYPKYKSAVQLGNTTEEDGSVDSDYPQTLDPPVDAVWMGYKICSVGLRNT